MGRAEYAGLAGFFNGVSSGMQEHFKTKLAKEEQMRQEDEALRRALILKEMDEPGRLLRTVVSAPMPTAGPMAGAPVPTMMANYFNPVPAPDPMQALPSAQVPTEVELTPEEKLSYYMSRTPQTDVRRAPIEIPPEMILSGMDEKGNKTFKRDDTQSDVFVTHMNDGSIVIRNNEKKVIPAIPPNSRVHTNNEDNLSGTGSIPRHLTLLQTQIQNEIGLSKSPMLSPSDQAEHAARAAALQGQYNIMYNEHFKLNVPGYTFETTTTPPGFFKRVFGNGEPTTTSRYVPVGPTPPKTGAPKAGDEAAEITKLYPGAYQENGVWKVKIDGKVMRIVK